MCAARTGIGDDVLAGLPELPVHGLGDSDARALLLGNVYGPLDAAVCDQIITESHGNPLALLELPRTWNVAELAGGFGLPAASRWPARSNRATPAPPRCSPPRRSCSSSPRPQSRSATPCCSTVPPRRSGSTWLRPALRWTPGLLKIGGRVEFAHPLVRSAAYRSAAADDRHRVHRALAEATDPETDPDRRAWHLARATPGPDEEVAAELERSAGRAQARGGVAAAAAFLQRAVALTVDPARRAERALAAAQASFQAGAFDAALGLLATAEAGPLDEFQRARVGSAARPRRVRLGPRQRCSAVAAEGREAARAVRPGARARDLPDRLGRGVSRRAARRSGRPPGDLPRRPGAPPAPGAPRPLDLLLEGLALLTTDGHAAATPTLQRAATALADIAVEDVLRWGWMATAASTPYGTTTACSRSRRDRSSSSATPARLRSCRCTSPRWASRARGSVTSRVPPRSSRRATASRRRPGAASRPSALLRLRALQGRETEASAAIASAIEQAAAGGQGAATWAHWAAAVLYNGLARYEEAVAAARQATSNTFELWVSVWALPELVEAAARTGDAELARDALERLAETTQPCGTDCRARHRGALPGAAERRRGRRRALSRSDRSA